MKFFDEFKIDIGNYKGIIEIYPGYKSASITINGEKYELNTLRNINRVFNGDLVEFIINNNEIIVTNQLINTLLKKKIVGVLQVKTKTIIGVNKKNMPIYNFRPFDKTLPTFHVASNYLKKNKPSRNVYAIIEFNKWSIDSLNPVGICENVIGEVGNLENEKELIFYLHNLNFSNFKNKDIQELQDYVNDNNNFIELDKDRIDLTEKKIFSIDPDGCEDIDDAIHIEKNGDNYIIGVHIADVSAYIEEGSNIDILAKNRCSTIYLHKRIDMIPSIISTKIASLHEGEKKRAVSVLYEINNEGNIQNIIYKRSFIKNNKAFTYDKIDEIIKNKKSKYLEDILLLKNIVDKISSRYIKITQEIDSHSLIETLMILTNCTIADIIYKKYPEKAILRIHDGIDSQRWNNIYDNENLKNLDKDIINSIKILYTNSAKYDITSNIETNKEILHIGLNKKYYTHFTSPIRRYIDIIIHRMLLIDNYNLDINNLVTICSKVNDYQKNIKKAERDYQKLCLLEKILENVNLNLNETVEYEIKAFIIDIKLNNITIFIPNLNMLHNLYLLSNKLNNLVKYELKGPNLLITNQQTNKNIEIKLFQNILIKLTAMPYNEYISKKIFTKIIEPDVFSILE